MASDEIDMDMVLGAGGVVDSYTNSDAAVGELLPNINSDDDPALLGLDIDMSATATEVRAYCESILYDGLSISSRSFPLKWYLLPPSDIDFIVSDDS